MSGIFLVLINVCIPFLSKEVRKNGRLAAACLVVMLSHISVSALQVYFHGLPTLSVDPISFNGFASTGEGRLAHDSYAKFLRYLYLQFDGDHFFGCQVSCFFFAFSLFVFIVLLEETGSVRVAPQAVLIYGMIPSCLLNTSVVFREPAQILAISLVLLCLIKIDKHRNYFLLIPIGLLLPLGIQLHQGFAMLIPVLAGLGGLFIFRRTPATVAGLLIVTLATGAVFGGKIYQKLLERSGALQRLTDEDQGLGYIETYAKGVGESRSSFGVFLDTSSLGSLIKTAPQVATYYLFSPLPWQIRGMLDLYGSFESFLRLGLFGFSVYLLTRKNEPHRPLYFFLAAVFIVTEGMWALGTFNWGTAFRHRLVAWPILVTLGVRGWIVYRTKGASDSELTPPKRSIKLTPREQRRRLNERRRAALQKEDNS